MFVGLGGNTGQFPAIVEFCRTHGLALILDAAHMTGTTLDGDNPALAADVAIYSFHAVKNLPTADAGMVCFADGEHDVKARRRSWLGIDQDTFLRTNKQGGYRWKYEVHEIGYKYHGNSIMAAIARRVATTAGWRLPASLKIIRTFKNFYKRIPLCKSL